MKKKMVCNAYPKYVSGHVLRSILRISISLHSAREWFVSRTGQMATSLQNDKKEDRLLCVPGRDRMWIYFVKIAHSRRATKKQ